MLNVNITTSYLATLLLRAYADHHYNLNDDERALVTCYCENFSGMEIEDLEVFVECFISDHDFVKTEELEKDIYQDCEVICATQKLALIQLY